MRSLLLVGVCLLAVFTVADVSQAECPPCYKNRSFMESNTRAHQLPAINGCNCATAGCPGCSSDARRVIRVRFDTTPGNTWVNGQNSNGYIVEPAIYEATLCALNAWNTTRGSNNETVPFYFVIDQDATDAQIVIRNEQPASAPFASIGGNSTPPYTMRLAPEMKDSDWTSGERCGSIKHELGHALNAGDLRECVDPSVSIMSGLNWDNWRFTNTIHARDVNSVQRNVSNQNTCSADITGDANETVECYDMDGDGWTTCEDDCDDYDPYNYCSQPNYTYSYCYSSYLVTDHYISWDNGATWSYWYSDYEYLGYQCMLTQ